jgi:hypothetical protein
MNGIEILVWDCCTCESQSLDFISHLQRYRKGSFAGVIIAAREPATVPPGLGDLAICLPITTRLGANAVYDTLVDAVTCYVQAKGNCSFVVISNSLPLWITLFQRIEPKSVTFLSNRDLKSHLEFTFLPEKIPVRLLAWPTLEEFTSSGQEEAPSSPSSVHEPEFAAEEEQVEAEEDENEHPSTFNDDETPGKPHMPVIQPLKNMESHHIDLRSPTCGSPSQSDSERVTPRREPKPQPDQGLQVSVRFKALIEVMRSIGKDLRREDR